MKRVIEFGSVMKPRGKRTRWSVSVFLCFDLFNPLKKRQVGEMPPSFEFIPRFGVAIDRVTKLFSVTLAWLNVAVNLHMYIFQVKRYYKRPDETGYIH